MSESLQNWCYDQLKVDISWHICPLWHFFLDFLIQMYALFTHGSLAQELLAAWGRRGQWGSCNRHFAWSFVAQQVDPNIINYPPCDIIYIYFYHLSVCLSLIDLNELRLWLNQFFFPSKNEALKGLGVGWSSRQPPIFPMDFSVGASMPRNLCSQSLEKVSDQRSMTSLRGRPGFISLSPKKLT